MAYPSVNVMLRKLSHGYVRYDLILEPAQEQDGNVSDLWNHFFTGPHLVAKRRQVLGCRNHTAACQSTSHRRPLKEGVSTSESSS